MQTIKLFMRAVGEPSAQLGIIPLDVFEEELEYKYLSQGFNILATHYLGEVKNEAGGAAGYKILLVLQKEDSPAKAAKQTLKDVGK
jgi:hypothetical protein